MNSAWWCLGASLIAFTACSSSSGSGGGSTTVTGKIAGASIPTTDTIGIEGTLTVGGQTAYEAVVLVTNQGDACTLAKNLVNPPNATALTLVVGSGAGPLGPGTYPVGTVGSASAVIGYSTQDAMCVGTVNATAMSGSVTLSTVSATILQGTFEATFPNGDKVSGTFDAPVCSASLNNLAAGASAPCKG